MDRADDILRATERLYAAIAAPPASASKVWTPALEAVADLVRGSHVILVGRENGSGPFVHAARVDEQHLARCFFSAEGQRLAAPMLNAAPVGVAVRAAFIPDADFLRSAGYNELIRPMNGRHSVHARHEGAGGFVLNVCRPPQAENFDATDVEPLRRLAPHLATALALQSRLQIAEQRTAGLAQTLDRLDSGVILTDGAARVLMLNACAERMIADADGLAIDAAGLAAASPVATRQLRDAIAVTGHDSAVETSRLRLPRPSRRLPLLVTLIPVWRLGAAVPGAGVARVAVFVSAPDAPRPIDRAAIAATFRLTRRESDIAVLIADGLDRETVAARLGIGRGTVREHLRHVFDKTGVRSQAALVALLRGFVDP